LPRTRLGLHRIALQQLLAGAWGPGHLHLGCRAAARSARSGTLQFWMGPGAHLLHYPIAGGSLINFLAVVEGPQRWTAPAWMDAAAPGAHLETFAGWHLAVTKMLTAVPQSPRWGLFTPPPLRR
jgi:hypothetical protein